jgi:hypothetical protein
VINTGKAEAQVSSKNPHSIAYFMSGVLPSYFSREFSFARMRLPVESKTMKICHMHDNILYVVDDLNNPMHYSGEIEP